MVIAGGRSAARARGRAAAGFNGAGDGDRRRGMAGQALPLVLELASTEPAMVIAGGLEAPAAEPEDIGGLQRSRRW